MKKMKKEVARELLQKRIALSNKNIEVLDNYCHLFGATIEEIDGVDIQLDFTQSEPDKLNNFRVWLYKWNESHTRCIYICEDGDKGVAKCGHFENMDLVSNKEHIKNYLNDKRTIQEMRRNFVIVDRWNVGKVENNKPSKLQEIAENLTNNLVYFVAVVGSCFRVFGWDIDNRRAVCVCSFGYGFNISSCYTLQDANEARKQAKELYCIFAPIEESKKAQQKHQDRQKNKNLYDDNQLKRFSKKEQHIHYTLGGYYPNYYISSVLGVRVPDELRYIAVNESEQQNAVNKTLSNCFDNSGYFILEKRQELARRNERAKRERARKEWESESKQDKINNILTIKHDLILMFEKVTKLKKFDFYTMHRLEDIAEVIQLSDRIIKDIKNYRSCADFVEDFAKLQRLKRKIIILLCVEPSDPRAYGFIWWELNEDQTELKNSRNDKDYYKSISITGKATTYEELHA